jgi:hypothetical protein
LILDLHVHSVFSLDSPTRVEAYAERISELREEFEIDGFALMEHNKFISPEEIDLAAIGARHGLVILSGVEIDTYWGHFLVYGMTPELWAKIAEANLRKQEPVALARLIVEDGGALLAPAHPFRTWIGAGERCRDLAGMCALEGLNGANDEAENRTALNFAKKMNWATIGGSDAHFPAEIGKALTRLDNAVSNMAGLAAEIRAGRCRAISMEEARRKSHA